LALALRERKLARAGDDHLTEALVISLEKLLSPAMPAMISRLSRRLLAADEGRSRGLRAPSARSLVRQWQNRRDLERTSDFEVWRTERGIDEKDVAVWLEQRFLALAAIRSTPGGRLSEQVDTVVNEALSRIGDPRKNALSMPGCSPGVPWESVLVREWKMLGRWPAAVARAREIVAIRDDVEQKTSGLIAALSPRRLEGWFAQRWNVSDTDLRGEALRRGFASYREFIDTARVAYMADRQWARGASRSQGA
jgi:hypothetical protein